MSLGDDGKLLLKCFAGCSVEAICAAVGWQVSDLFADKGRSGSAKLIEATYPYRDENGDLLFEVVRFTPKDFRQRRPDASAVGGYSWNLKGINRVLFRLPEIKSAVQLGAPIYVCEGERDVLAMVAAGFEATCNPGGAGKWFPNYSETLRDADVIVIADKDAPGRTHAADVAQKLFDIARSVKALELPNVDGKPVKDAADFFDAGGEAAELDDMAQNAPCVTPDTLPKAQSAWSDFVEDGADIEKIELPRLVEIVEGIVGEQSKLVIASGAKAFKTWLTILMTLCISHGLPFLGRRTVRRRVLYVNLELKPSTFHRRLQAVARALSVTIDATWFKHLPLRGRLGGLTLDEIVSRLIALCKQFDTDVIVLDPLFKLNIEG